MSTANNAILKAHLEAENAHELEAIMATYSDSPSIELNGSRIEGLAATCEFHRSFGFGGGEGSFSDVHVAERRRYATHDAIVIEQTLTGRHTGAWRGIAATGATISIAVCTVYAFEGGRLARESVYLDEGRLQRTLSTAGQR